MGEYTSYRSTRTTRSLDDDDFVSSKNPSLHRLAADTVTDNDAIARRSKRQDEKLLSEITSKLDIYDAPLPHPRHTTKRSSSTHTNSRRTHHPLPTPTPSVVGKSVSYLPFATPGSWRDSNEHGLYPYASSPWSYYYLNAPTATKSYRDFALSPQSWNPSSYNYLKSVHAPQSAKGSYDVGLNAYPWVYQPWSYGSLSSGRAKNNLTTHERNLYRHGRQPYSWDFGRYYDDLDYGYSKHYPYHSTYTTAPQSRHSFDDLDLYLNPYTGRPWGSQVDVPIVPRKRHHEYTPSSYAQPKYVHHQPSNKKPTKHYYDNLYPNYVRRFHDDSVLDLPSAGHSWRYPYLATLAAAPARSYDYLDLAVYPCTSYVSKGAQTPRRYYDDELDLYPCVRSSYAYPYVNASAKTYAGLYSPYSSYAASPTRRFYDDMDLDVYHGLDHPSSTSYVPPKKHHYNVHRRHVVPRVSPRISKTDTSVYDLDYLDLAYPTYKTSGWHYSPHVLGNQAAYLRGVGDLAVSPHYLDASRRRYDDFLGPDYETNRRVEALVDYDLPNALRSLSNVRDHVNEVKGGMGAHRMLIDRYLTLDLGPSQEVDYEVARKYYELASRMPELEPDKYHKRALYADSGVNLAGSGRSRSVGNIRHYGQFNQPVSETRNRLRKVITKARRDPTFYSY